MSTNILPDAVTLAIADDGFDSYFGLTIHDTVLSGIYNAWCVDRDTFVHLNTDYTAVVYSSYEPIPAGLIERPENLDLINWIINQDSVSRNYSVLEIQEAIWHLVESDYVTTDPGSLVIISEAEANGEGFVPAPGEEVAVIFAPQLAGVEIDPAIGSEAQTIIATTTVPAPAIAVEKQVSVDDGTTWLDADTPTGPFALDDGNSPQFKFSVTNTGETDLNHIALTDSDFDLNGAAPGTSLTVDALAPQAVYEYTFTEAEWQPGQHTNTATVTVDYTSDLTQQTHTLSASDAAHYFGDIPVLTLEKFTNGADADSLETAAIAPAGEAVIWQYYLTNDGNSGLSGSDLTIVDDQEVVITLDTTTDWGNDGVLSPGEEWTYWGEDIATDLTFTLDFDTDAEGNILGSGDTIVTQYQSMGITLSTPGHQHGAMIFDTAQVTGQDRDLRDPNLSSGENLLGNVLILSEDGDADDADDNAGGGTFRFDFDDLIGISGVNLLDIDRSETVTIQTFDAAGTLLETWTLDGAGNNEVQTADISTGLIAALEVELSGSGAITGLEGDRFYVNTATATLAGFPDATVSDRSHYINRADSSVLG